MKKIKVTAVILVVSVILAAAIFTKSNSFLDITTVAAPKVDLSFSVLGDVHGNTGKFEEIIRALYKMRSDMDVMILNGDAVDQGLQSQYDSIKKVVEKNKKFLPETIIKNIGNHEYLHYGNGVNTEEYVNELKKRYLDFAGEERVYHDKWVNGYHFISLGSESGNTKDHNSTAAYIFDEQLKWFEQKMAEKYEKGKPIFVFLHQHLNGSSKGWVGSEQSEKIRKVLLKYPEAILFTSHTHASLETTNVNTNESFTSVHTGAVHYTFKVNEKGERERANETYALYVEVNKNSVLIKGRDFKNNTWVFEKEISK
jgi:hypothetical protein